MKLFRRSYEDEPDELLVKLSSQGGKKAFTVLYDRYFNKLVWFARQFVFDRQQAEDIVQEVFVKIIEKPEQFDSTRRFSTWVYTVTSNQCRNILRNEQNRSKLLEENVYEPDAGVHMHHRFDHQVLKERLKRTYSSLSDKEKQVFVLRFEQELSLKEIALIMSIPEGSVKSCIYYLLKKISSQLKEFDHGKRS